MAICIKMLFNSLLLSMSVAPIYAAIVPPSDTTKPISLPVHNITRWSDSNFENLAIRPNGQILSTTTRPNASVFQVDPLGILPPTLIHFNPDSNSSAGIAEGKPDLYYVAMSTFVLTEPNASFPGTYFITEIDMRGVDVYPNGSLTRQPATKRVANVSGAGLLNGVAFSRPGSDNLLVADSFKGLVWNVNVCSGNVSVALNDTTTKGIPGASNSSFTGINGIKEHEGTLYWTVTGTSKMFKVPIDETGMPRDGAKPALVAEGISCDDLAFDWEGNAYVAGTANFITKVNPNGEKQIIAGTPGSNSSDLMGPSAIRFGRLVSDRWSMYITTNGGLPPPGASRVLGVEGISRIDLKK